ncbi:phosphoenolpyruvate carboxykinase (ATP) [Pedobacter sp. PACM 27299]|uniref:phosphoenolpyruvate carboxykinase (ATP) n=1 Tax=Pedobacter sp. PACM 27299 TaxID=1727164 RepID=UPI000A52CE61|nr:phosphoenolpyruvate carboxykinase (ATP) [Pedobacter sp. PACM 27299]
MKTREKRSLTYLGINGDRSGYWNISTFDLIINSIRDHQCELTSAGALACNTGKFTGRSPKDKYIVAEELTENNIWWGEVNHKLSEQSYECLYKKVTLYLSSRDVYVRDVFACAAKDYRLKIRVVTEHAWQSLFAYNLFLRPNTYELSEFSEDWVILSAPGFKANPKENDIRSENFTVINFKKKVILIGGTAYTGEIKKAVFTVLNYILPQERNVLPMHCSANVGERGDTAIFFGLSGTGKTTLSADPDRKLIGDDEHGWDANSVFNLEGGCYAKCVDLSPEKEPQIFNAIKFGTLLENVCFYPNHQVVNYTDTSITENTRAAYPIDSIENIVEPSVGKPPENIFFLTADAFGVLPPISKLNVRQAMYHFISGYTSKVAGTEVGIKEPQITFSACFGKPFLPLHPVRYASMLGEKLKSTAIKVWLINTGWTGGSYGIGERIKLEYTRAMVTAVLNGQLEHVEFKTHQLFDLAIPMSCPGVPSNLLSPENTWADKNEYQIAAKILADEFAKNFKKYKEQ